MGSVIGYESINGNIVSFETDVAEKIKNLKINIEPIQAGSGTPNPDNVRPITGWTGVQLERSGKNLLEVTAQTATLNGVTFTIADGIVTLSGTATTRTTLRLAANFFLKAGTYKLNGSQQTLPIACYLNINGGGISVSEAGNIMDVEFTLSEDSTMNYVRLDIAGGTNTDGLVFKPMIRLASVTGAAYEPYAGNVYPITFPSSAGTVYGGTLDVITGELVVDQAMQNITTGGDNGFRDDIQMVSIRCPGKAFGLSGFFSNIFSIGPGIYQMTGRSTSNLVEFRLPFSVLGVSQEDSSTVRMNAVRTWLAENPLQIVYPLDEPITYQLTPLEIQTMIGTNNIYADTGDTSVIYPKTITPVKTISNVSLIELRRNIIAAQAYDKTADVTLNLGTHQVYPTDSIESLRKYLTVVSRGSGTAVTNYTLHGSIDTVGNHQIIIDCHPGIVTIQVPVVTNPSGILYEWDFTKSLTDERQNYTAILKTGEADEVPGKSTGTTPPIRDDTGVVFNNAQQVLRLLDSDVDSSALMLNKTIQIDIAEFNYVYNGTTTPGDSRKACFIMFGDPLATENKGSMLYTRGIILNKDWNWIFFYKPRDDETVLIENILLSGKNAISGHTIGIYRNNSGTINFYVDSEYKNTSRSILPPAGLHGLQIGAGGRPQYGGAFYNARITGVRIYNGEVTP